MDNETLFYLCGGVLAISAIVTTAIGLKSEKFPGKALPLVIVWFAVFVVGAATFAIRYSTEEREHKEHELSLANEEIEAAEGKLGESGEVETDSAEEGAQEEETAGEDEGSEAAGGAGTTLKLAADEAQLAYDQTGLSAKAGEVTIDFDNPAPIEHNVVIEKNGKELAGFEPIVEGEEEVSAELEAGSYTFYCSVPGHREAGMEGTLTVK